MDDDLIIGLIIIVVVVGIVVVIAFYASIAIGIAGAVWGLCVAFYSYVVSAKEVVRYRKALSHCKDKATFSSIEPLLIKAKNGNSGNKVLEKYVYEDVSRNSYFLGPCFSDAGVLIRQAFSNNFKHRPDFSKGEDVFALHAAWIVFSIARIISIYVFGTIFTLVLSLIFVALGLCAMILIYPVLFITLMSQKIYFKSKKISNVCPKCKSTYVVPVYSCPSCGLRHADLEPGKFGIKKRTCLCDTVLPLTAKAKGTKWTIDPSTRYLTAERFLLKDLDSYCPKCGVQHNAALTRPIGIAMIGGQSSGKTTFKVAFLRDFINEELTTMGADYELLNEDTEFEFKEMEKQYSGRPIPPTRTGTDADISSFVFSISHKKLPVDRTIQIFDMPGEVFLNGSAKEGWGIYEFNDGAVFIIDPYSLTGIREENERELNGAIMGISNVKMGPLSTALVNTMESVNAAKAATRKFKLPMAVTINKIDTPLLKKQVGEDAINALMANNPTVFTDYFSTMDYVCRCFLARHNGRDFINTMDNYYQNVHFFSCSSMGYVPKGALSRFHPINVMSVMKWIMVKADGNLRKIWQNDGSAHFIADLNIADLKDVQKKLYMTNPDYYEEYIRTIS